MDWEDVANAAKSIAPGASALCDVLSLIPGVGTIAGGAKLGIKALTAALGVSEDAKPDQVMAAIQADPQAALKILQAENDYKLEVQRISLEELKAGLADVQGARTRQVEHEKVTGKTDYNLYLLAWTIVVGFFLLMGFLLKIPVPQDQNGVIFMLFGSLATGFGQVLGYFFGSSKSSADKTEQMGKMREKLGK
jgi:hypothetical protein